jgi:hypothetical protein
MELVSWLRDTRTLSAGRRPGCMRCGDLAGSNSHTELFEGRQCFPKKITGCFAVAGRITSPTAPEQDRP